MITSSRERDRAQALFARLGRFDIRFRWLIVAGWIVLVVLGTVSLPSLSANSKANNTQFLSSSSPSVRAARLATPFTGSKSASLSAILIAARASGPLTPADLAAVGRAEQAARRVAGVEVVRDEGVSRDGKAAEALITVTAAAADSSGASEAAVDAIRSTFRRVSAPPGLTLHLTGQLAISVDSSNTHSGAIAIFTLLFVVVLLFVVYRAALAPLITLIPAVLSFLLAERLVGVAAQAGLSMPSVSQQLLIVLLLGAGTDYGLFLSSRVREELARGTKPREAVITAMAPIGEAVTYSAATVIAALLTLLLATFAIYRGLGPALAIGVAVLLAATLTLTPALLAIFGRSAFWPSHPRAEQRPGAWGAIAGRVVKHPRATLAAGIAVLAVLAAGLVGYRTAGLTNNTAPAGSDSAAGQQILAAHFPKANVGADQLLLRYPTSVWEHPATLAAAQHELAAAPVLRSITGPLGSGPGQLSPTTLARLHRTLGPASTLPPSPPTSSKVAPGLYRAYRQTAQRISPDGRTVQYYAVLSAGAVGSTAAADQIPQARAALARAAQSTGASANGIAGQDASTHDINAASTSSLELIVPIVLALILVLLALLLRSLIAPWYLALTVGLSYLASLGFAMLAFVHLGGDSGLIFVLPLLMFVFSMALGEDYNILIISRIREEAGKHRSFNSAVAHAITITGTTVTSAGIILAGTFAVLGIAGGSSEATQLGFGIAFGVLLDTFCVRTLLVPSIAVLLGRWNWWPSRLLDQPEHATATAPPAAAAPVTGAIPGPTDA